MAIPDRIVNEVAQKTDIVELISEYVQLKPQGKNYVGLSPFTNEKTPSFNVNREKGVYYCFSSGKGGSAFTFIMEMEGVSFPEAVRILGHRVGVTVDEGKDHDAEASQRGALLELYRRVAGSFQYLLEEHDSGRVAREYLERRGILPETRQAFQLGLAPDKPAWLYRFLLKKGYSDSFLKESGLFTRKNPSRALFVNRLMFPIHARNGDVIAFGGRALGDGPKYINSPNTMIFHKSSSLYGLPQALPRIRETGRFRLVEGYTDVLALHQAGLTEAVAPLGTSFTEEQARLLRRYASKAILVFDDDEAGFRATVKSAALCERHGFWVFVVPLRDGRDPADLALDTEPEALRKSLDCTIHILEYLVSSLSESGSEGVPGGKAFVVRELFPYIDSVESEVRREECLTYVADALGLNRRSVALDYERWHNTNNKRGGVTAETEGDKTGTDRHRSVELFLFLGCVIDRQEFSRVRTYIRPEELQDRQARELFIALEECYRREEEGIDPLLSKIEDPKLEQYVLQACASEEFRYNQAETIRQALTSVRRAIIERKRESVNSRLRRLRAQGSEETYALLEEKMHLDQELQKLKVAHDD